MVVELLSCSDFRVIWNMGQILELGLLVKIKLIRVKDPDLYGSDRAMSVDVSSLSQDEREVFHCTEPTSILCPTFKRDAKMKTQKLWILTEIYKTV